MIVRSVCGFWKGRGHVHRAVFKDFRFQNSSRVIVPDLCSEGVTACGSFRPSDVYKK